MTLAIFAHKGSENQHNRSSYRFRAVETPERAVPMSLPDSHVAIATLAATDDEQFQAYLAKTRRALPDMPMPDWYPRFLSELFDYWDGIKIAAGQLAECRAVLDRVGAAEQQARLDAIRRTAAAQAILEDRVRAERRKAEKEQRRRDAERRAAEKTERKERALAQWLRKPAMPGFAGAT
jgi:hypothetical protein